MTEDKNNNEESDNTETNNDGSSIQTPNEALQTKIADEVEQLSASEIDEKLQQAEPSAIDHRLKQLMQPTGLEAISVNDLELEEMQDEEKLDCLNCSTPLEGAYCHNCGQPERHFMRSLPKVLWEMINEAFDLDSKTFRTVLPLMIFPGRLTMEYIAGRRAQYVNPLRLYIILSVLFFISISIFTDSTGEETGGEQTQQQSSIRYGSQSGLMDEDGKLDISLENGEKWHVENNPIIFNNSLSTETNQALNQFLWSMATKLDAAIKNDPSVLVDQFFNVIPQLMFILLPLFALLLKLTYIFKKRYYMEHLIVALHSHCFIFFSLLLMILLNALSRLVTEDGWIAEILHLLVIALVTWLPVNIYLIQKRVYGQGYLMTSLKYIFVGITYILLLQITATAAFVVGLASL